MLRATKTGSPPSADRVLARTGHPRVRFILEQHLGHRTYSDNLLHVARSDISIDVEHVAVEYRQTLGTHLPDSLARVAGAFAGRREVRNGLRTTASDIDVYNTQVPAALAGRKLVHPYVIVTDVTPVQYDAMADGYGHSADHALLVHGWKRRVNERVFRGAAHCVGWSNWAASSFVRHYGVSSERVSVVPPGVDLDRWRPAPSTNGTLQILFVGGDLRRKGGDLLLDVVRELPRDVHLTLVTTARLASTERVTVVNDAVPNDDRLIRLYQRADVFVLPTLAETFGIAAVEASAVGLPVIATDVGGLSDIVVNGTTGILVPPDDAGALRTALTALIDDADQRRHMSEAARQHAEANFDATANAHRLIGIATSVLH